MKSNLIRNNIWIWLWIAILLLSGCSEPAESTEIMPAHTEMQSISQLELPMTTEQWIENYVASMTLQEKIGQMFYVTLGNLYSVETGEPNSITVISEEVVTNLQEFRPGGVILMGDNLESDEQVMALITDLQESTELPLFIGVDEEGGAVSRLGSNPGISMENIGSMDRIGATGDSEQAYEAGCVLGTGLNRLGFNMDFAPVADVLTDTANYEIGSRSFGSDPKRVADMVAAEITGLHQNGVCTVAKHFPGHGAVQGNSHNNLQIVDTSVETLQTVDFIPFQRAIEADTDAILVSHLILSAYETETPSSLSKEVVTGCLRENLDYNGIIITDSFQMGSITKNYTQSEAAIQAVQAGCDMILMPTEYEACYQGLLKAVEEGRISEEQIDAACKRILWIKIKRGILTVESVGIPRFHL